MATVGDTFVEASGTIALSAHTPTGANAGTAWTIEQQTGTAFLRVPSATDVCSTSAVEAADNIIATLQPNPSTADVDVQATVTDAAFAGNLRPFYLVARFADTSNYYAAGTYRAAAAADKKIWKKVGGTATELASGDAGLVNGDVLKFEVRDATKKLFHNGGEVLSTADNAITAAGKAGVGCGNGLVSGDEIGAISFDDFSYVEVAGAGALSINLADTVTITEDISLKIPLLPAPFDTVTVAEAITLRLPLLPAPFETVTVAESVALGIPILPSVFDAVTIVEAVTAFLPFLGPSVADAVSIADVVDLKIPLLPSTSDAVTVTEALTVFMPILGPSVVDAVTVSESTTITFGNVVVISAFDAVTVVEAVTVLLPFLAPTVSDSVSLVEAITALIPYLPASSLETVTVAESVTVLLPFLAVTVDDGVAVAESSTVSLGQLIIAVVETVSVIEATTITVGLQVLTPTSPAIRGSAWGAITGAAWEPIR